MPKYEIKTMPRNTKGVEEGHLPKPKQRSIYRKLLILIISTVIILLVGSLIYYWWNYIRVPVSEDSGLEITDSIIKTERTETIIMDENIDLFEELKKRTWDFQEANSFRRIVAKKQGRILSLKEIFEILNISISDSIANSFAEEYLVFFYAEKQGNRLGIISKINNSELVKEQLESWEETMIQDLTPVFLNEDVGESIEGDFQDGLYQEINIRYQNFSNSSFALDYAIAKDYLIITTSKDSTYAVIDKL